MIFSSRLEVGLSLLRLVSVVVEIVAAGDVVEKYLRLVLVLVDCVADASMTDSMIVLLIKNSLLVSICLVDKQGKLYTF